MGDWDNFRWWCSSKESDECRKGAEICPDFGDAFMAAGDGRRIAAIVPRETYGVPGDGSGGGDSVNAYGIASQWPSHHVKILSLGEWHGWKMAPCYHYNFGPLSGSDVWGGGCTVWSSLQSTCAISGDMVEATHRLYCVPNDAHGTPQTGINWKRLPMIGISPASLTPRFAGHAESGRAGFLHDYPCTVVRDSFCRGLRYNPQGGTMAGSRPDTFRMWDLCQFNFATARFREIQDPIQEHADIRGLHNQVLDTMWNLETDPGVYPFRQLQSYRASMEGGEDYNDFSHIDEWVREWFGDELICTLPARRLKTFEPVTGYYRLMSGKIQMWLSIYAFARGSVSYHLPSIQIRIRGQAQLFDTETGPGGQALCVIGSDGRTYMPPRASGGEYSTEWRGELGPLSDPPWSDLGVTGSGTEQECCQTAAGLTNRAIPAKDVWLTDPPDTASDTREPWEGACYLNFNPEEECG